MRSVALICLLATPGQAEEDVQVPSGQPVTFVEVVRYEAGPNGKVARFRFVAPAIAGGVGFDRAVGDMQHLCDAFALPRVTETVPFPTQIIISLSAAPVPFGEAAPEVTQYFEAYSLQDGACIWEVF